MNLKSVVLALAVSASAPALAADPFASDWAPSLKSAARLIADGAGQGGFQIKLASGAITYWRDPGEAGVPPTFDFSGSVNLARAAVAFPAPKRIAEPDGTDAFGYDAGVVLPIRVEPADPSLPVTLAILANYAVCEKICLPARASLKLKLPMGVTTPFAGDIEAARASIPKPQDAAALGAELTALEARKWRYCVKASPGAPRDLFVEAPAGWWLTANAAGSDSERDCFALALRDAPANAVFPASIRATITGGAGPVETELTLAPKS